MSAVKTFLPALALVLVAGMTTAVRADDREDVAKRMTNATKALQEATPDRAAIAEAKCIAVVPNLTEAALGIGGKHGEGVATCKTAQGSWSAPVFINLTGGTIGVQAGVERKDIVILAMTEKGKERFLQKDFDLGATAEATGGNRSAGTDWHGKDVAVFTSSKGAFAGVNLSGAQWHHDDTALETVYGKSVNADSVLNGQVQRSAMTADFMREMERLAPANPATSSRPSGVRPGDRPLGEAPPTATNPAAPRPAPEYPAPAPTGTRPDVR